MIYSPAEDSYLLNNVLKKEISELLSKNKNLKFLEIGAGSGINLSTAEQSGISRENIFACDIDEDAVMHCSSFGYNCIKSDLFQKIKGKFDIISFNPPYLPEHKYDMEKDTSGGKKGNEIILRFLQQAKSHLEKDGKIFLLTSNLTPETDFEEHGYKAKEIASENLFHEKLFVWELTL